jgi:hypothetical protein
MKSKDVPEIKVPTPEVPEVFKFKDAEVSANYNSTLGIDKWISIPGLYGGYLSNINTAAAERLIELGDNQIVKK